MLHRLDITNYRSIARAHVELRPFTLLVGANGSGKSNLLRLLLDLSRARSRTELTKHFNLPTSTTQISIHGPSGLGVHLDGQYKGPKHPELSNVRRFLIDPARIGDAEVLVARPEVKPDGEGAVQVLDSLKTGDREDLFQRLEATFRDFVPEIEKLSFVPGQTSKRLQVREDHIGTPVLVSDLSEGARLILTILAIAFQERKPSIICLEGLDRGLHPALFAKLVLLCRSLTEGPDAPQIIATTHNPYLVDELALDEAGVVLVEKSEGKTSFTPLSRAKGPGSQWFRPPAPEGAV